MIGDMRTAAKHGTSSSYTNRGCRCDECCRYNREKNRQRGLRIEVMEKERAAERAMRRARRRLSRMHVADYHQLLQEERLKEPLLNSMTRRGHHG